MITLDVETALYEISKKLDELIKMSVRESGVSTVFIAVISGVLVSVLFSYVDNYVLKPRLEYKKLLAEIEVAMTKYANVYSVPRRYDPAHFTPDPKREEVESVFREFAGRLRTFAGVGFPFSKNTRSNMREASGFFIGLSNSLYQDIMDKTDRVGDRACKYADEIYETLGINR